RVPFALLPHLQAAVRRRRHGQRLVAALWLDDSPACKDGPAAARGTAREQCRVPVPGRMAVQHRAARAEIRSAESPVVFLARVLGKACHRDAGGVSEGRRADSGSVFRRAFQRRLLFTAAVITAPGSDSRRRTTHAPWRARTECRPLYL